MWSSSDLITQNCKKKKNQKKKTSDIITNMSVTPMGCPLTSFDMLNMTQRRGKFIISVLVKISQGPHPQKNLMLHVLVNDWRYHSICLILLI